MSPSKEQIEQAPSLVEELAALLREFIPTATMSERAARAILSALASKGVDGMPSVADAWKAYNGQYNEHNGIIAVERMYRLALGPILAAKDAELQIEREQRQRFGDMVEQRTAERDALCAELAESNRVAGEAQSAWAKAVEEHDAYKRARVAELEARLSTNGDNQ